MILAIDPASKSGVTYDVTIDECKRLITESWDISAETATNPRKDGTRLREGEPKRFRLMKLWNKLNHLHNKVSPIEFIALEGALGFQKGKTAVEASHKFRAVIELFCCLNSIECVEIQPKTLKKLSTGNGNADKSMMIKAANSLGYIGDDDDEADSYLIYKWHCKNELRGNQRVL